MYKINAPDALEAWKHFRSVYGPRPGGIQAQRRWEAHWEDFAQEWEAQSLPWQS